MSASLRKFYIVIHNISIHPNKLTGACGEIKATFSLRMINEWRIGVCGYELPEQRLFLRAVITNPVNFKNVLQSVRKSIYLRLKRESPSVGYRVNIQRLALYWYQSVCQSVQRNVSINRREWQIEICCRRPPPFLEISTWISSVNEICGESLSEKFFIFDQSPWITSLWNVNVMRGFGIRHE